MADLDDRLHPPVFDLMTDAILNALGDGARTLGEVARATGLHSSTVIRTVAVLRDLQLVDVRIEDDILRIGPPCPRLG
jgi:DNA-binding IclR family transcriptional regulator